MDLYCSLSNADIVGNLLAEPPPCDVNHDLSLPGTQGRKTSFEVGQRAFTLPADAIARQAELNRVKKLLIADRLGEKLDRATFHGLHRHRNIGVSRDKDDRQVSAGRREFTLEFETALPRQSHVQHQAAWPLRRLGFEKIGNRGK